MCLIGCPKSKRLLCYLDTDITREYCKKHDVSEDVYIGTSMSAFPHFGLGVWLD